MANPQPQSFLGPLTEAAIFLVATVNASGEDDARGLLADVGGLRRSVGFRGPGEELTLTIRAHAEGQVSKYLVDAEPGQLLHLSQAQGDFTLPVSPATATAYPGSAIRFVCPGPTE